MFDFNATNNKTVTLSDFINNIRPFQGWQAQQNLCKVVAKFPLLRKFCRVTMKNFFRHYEKKFPSVQKFSSDNTKNIIHIGINKNTFINNLIFSVS
jgi:hypothetical protein